VLGFLLIDKPQGITSHDVVARLRRRLNTRRIGHAGTLDPLATGLLVVAVGPATRFLQYLDLEPKEYRVVMKFGVESDSYDADGQIVAEKPVPGDLEARVAEALPQFQGEIDQLPPLYSAVKKDGRPLYDYARKGIEVERTTRRVFIEQFSVDSWNGDELEAVIVCSGGTYVRTLAHDLGQAVGCGAIVTSLTREGVGQFGIEDALELDEASPEKLIPLAEALHPMPLITLNVGHVDYIRNGRPVPLKHEVPTKMVGLMDLDGNVVGVGRVEGSTVHPECVLPVEAMSDVL